RDGIHGLIPPGRDGPPVPKSISRSHNPRLPAPVLIPARSAASLPGAAGLFVPLGQHASGPGDHRHSVAVPSDPPIACARPLGEPLPPGEHLDVRVRPLPVDAALTPQSSDELLLDFPCPNGSTKVVECHYIM